MKKILKSYGERKDPLLRPGGRMVADFSSESTSPHFFSSAERRE
jgi:hypothetical protein